MAKRSFDILFAGLILLLAAPLLVVTWVAIFLQDFHSPIYRSQRIGRHGRPFTLLKFRSMVIDANKVTVDTTSANDPRLLPIGPIVRRTKLDEFPQFINVLRGEMSIVGPRPNVPREVAIYTDVEKRLMEVAPGITDLSSIVFSDLGEIVEHEADPDIAYSQLVRPWKSRLGLFYIEKRSFVLDLAIVGLTALNFIARPTALRTVAAVLERRGGDPRLVAVSRRDRTLEPTPPPGSDQIVQSRAVAREN